MHVVRPELPAVRRSVQRLCVLLLSLQRYDGGKTCVRLYDPN
jgi:hypothetical protein